MFCEQQADGLKWCGGTDIEDKPGRYVPESWMKKAKSVISRGNRIVDSCQTE